MSESKIIMAEHASQQGHWYDRDGNCAYEIIGANGKRRPTTLRDAKKLGLYPSVTTVINLAAKPGLQNWRDDQLIMACLTMPRIENEPEGVYIARIKRDAGEQARVARERGSTIHAWVQEGFEGKQISHDAYRYYASARDALSQECSSEKWECEKSFVKLDDRGVRGYGGKIDLISPEHIVDIKTTEKDVTTLKTWDEHHQQLAAYDVDDSRWCGILYVNVYSAESQLIWITPDEKIRGRECFNALLRFMYAKNGL